MTPKWRHRFLKLADHVSLWSKDPSTKVGAVIVDSDQRIISLGYNGFARGINDNMEDRSHKYMKVIHAEMNAILYARENLKGCSIFITNIPCSNCMASIIQAGIVSIDYYRPIRNYQERWFHNIRCAKNMLEEAGYKPRKKDPR